MTRLIIAIFAETSTGHNILHRTHVTQTKERIITSKKGRCLEVSGLVAMQILPPELSCERMPLKMSVKSSSTLMLCNAWEIIDLEVLYIVRNFNGLPGWWSARRIWGRPWEQAFRGNWAWEAWWRHCPSVSLAKAPRRSLAWFGKQTHYWSYQVSKTTYIRNNNIGSYNAVPNSKKLSVLSQDNINIKWDFHMAVQSKHWWSNLTIFSMILPWWNCTRINKISSIQNVFDPNSGTATFNHSSLWSYALSFHTSEWKE